MSTVAWSSVTRLYVVSYEATPKLYEVNYDAGTTPTWRNISGTGGPSLANTPYIDVAYDTFTNPGKVWIAVRASNGHVWTCHLDSSTSDCTGAWTDESCRGNLVGCSPISHIAYATSPVAISPTSLIAGAGDPLELYWITSDRRSIQHEVRASPTWDLAATLTSPAYFDSVSLRAATQSGVTRLVTAFNYGLGYEDDLGVARNTGTFGSWTFYDVTGSTFYSRTVDSSLNAARLALNGGNDVLWFHQSHHLMQCFLSAYGTTPVTCTSFVDRGQPADQLPNWDVRGSITATATEAYTVGTLAGTGYVWKWDGTNGAVWQNLLAPRDPHTYLTGTPPNNQGNFGEYEADEYYGTVYVVGSNANTTAATAVITSTDDGSTWANPIYPFSDTQFDQNVSVGAGGVPYVSASSSYGVHLARYDVASNSWLPPPASGFLLPASVNNVSDRPWMVADRYRSNFVYVTWASSNNGGVISYCNGKDCIQGGSWCPPTTNIPQGFTLPSGTGCRGDRGDTGCMIVQGGDQIVWVLIAQDQGCGAGPGGEVTFGVRQVTIPSGPGCPAPQLSFPPQCLSFRETATDPSSQLKNGSNSPAASRRWSARLAASRDSVGAMAVLVNAYVDIATGGDCGSSGPCRSDQMFAFFNGSAGWCGSSCATAANQSTLLWVNSDHTAPLAQVDHILGSLVALDNGYFGASWADFRENSSDTQYHYHTAAIQRVGSSGLSVTESATLPAVAPGVWGFGSNTSGSWYGDILGASNGRLHAHFVEPYATSPSNFTTIDSFIWSPQSAPQ